MTITMTTAAVPLALWSSAVFIASGDRVVGVGARPGRVVDEGDPGLEDSVDDGVGRLLVVEAAELVVEGLLLLPGAVDTVALECGDVVM